MKIEKIQMNPGEFEIIQNALDVYAQSFLEFQKECPEDCSEDEINRIVQGIRSVSDIISSIVDNSPITVDVIQFPKPRPESDYLTEEDLFTE